MALGERRWNKSLNGFHASFNLILTESARIFNLIGTNLIWIHTLASRDYLLINTALIDNDFAMSFILVFFIHGCRGFRWIFNLRRIFVSDEFGILSKDLLRLFYLRSLAFLRKTFRIEFVIFKSSTLLVNYWFTFISITNNIRLLITNIWGYNNFVRRLAGLFLLQIYWGFMVSILARRVSHKNALICHWLRILHWLWGQSLFLGLERVGSRMTNLSPLEIARRPFIAA